MSSRPSPGSACPTLCAARCSAGPRPRPARSPPTASRPTSSCPAGSRPTAWPSSDAAKAEREGTTAAEVTAASLATIPAGRYGDPREYAQTVTFLAGAPAGYITGSVVRVDGGYVPAI
ncbi:SDR family oxidoreductase [Janibacter limosus]|uniref:SDR family oxidoreductase n=1 Tax=Janibacter limosus TaxID=53458 RepID=UPI0035DE76DB